MPIIHHHAATCRRAVWVLPFLLVACAPPELPPQRAADMGDSPQLLPISAILAQAGPGVHTAALEDTALDARARALQARAARLRAPVLPEDERARLIASEQGMR
jgi:hypothetical protein